MIVNYDCTVIMIVNYDRKTFIIHATGYKRQLNSTPTLFLPWLHFQQHVSTEYISVHVNSLDIYGKPRIDQASVGFIDIYD